MTLPPTSPTIPEMTSKLQPILVDAETKRNQLRSKAISALRNVFPFEGRRYNVDVGDLEVHPADYGPEEHKRALLQARTLSEPIRGTLILKDKKGKVLQKIPKFNLLQLPYLTPHHTFVVGGNPYSVANQLRMKPGVYTRKRRNEELEAAFNLAKGYNFRLSMDPADGHFYIEYGASKVPLHPVLNKLGISDTDIAKYWNKDLTAANRKAFEKRAPKVINSLYEKLISPTRRVAGEDQTAAVKRVYAETQLDPHVTRRTLGKGFRSVTPEALLRASGKLLKAHQEGVDFDERDNLAYKQFKSVDDFIGERIELDARALRRKLMNKIEYAPSPDLERAFPSSLFTRGVNRFITTSALSGSPAQINPIEIMDAAVRVTSLGEGGIGSEYAIPAEARRLHSTHAGILDPVRTPESSKAGVDLRTAIHTARDEVGNIYTPVRNKKGRLIYVSAEELTDGTVAFPGQKMTGSVDVLQDNKIESRPVSEVDYTLPSAHALYSPASNLVPFLDSIDGNRATMASKFQTQALPLVDPESPLIQVATWDKRFGSMEEYLGKYMTPRSPITGTVAKIQDGFIHVRPAPKTAAAPSKVPVYTDFPLASRTFLHQVPIVSVGDHVTAGQRLAESIYAKDGRLALGKNLRVAYLPYRGKTTEDAIVVSESGAKKLTSRHMYRMGMDIENDMAAGREKHRTYYGNKYLSGNYDKLDDTGLIKPGIEILPGDLLIAAVQKSTLTPEAAILGKLHKSLVKPYRDAGLTWDRNVPGRVTDVVRTGNKIRLTVKTEEPLRIGDKISNRSAAKGVISEIIPDDQMIRDEQDRPLDVLFSSAGVVSRINPAQVLETALARVAEKTGKPIAVENFADRDNVAWVKSLLKKHNIKERETVFDPMTGKKIKNILVGPQYIQKLFKTTETNYSARGIEDYDVNEQPSAGGPRGAKGLGRMEVNALIGHDARNILREAAVLKSQRNDEYWRALQLGLPLPPLKTTFAYDKFGAMLVGAGIKPDKSGNIVTLGPLTDRDVGRISAGRITKPLLVRAKDLAPEKNGLFDPGITGGPQGKLWSHIDLQESVVNPTFERPVKTFLGLKQKDFNQLVREEGGRGIHKRLAAIDIKKREAEVLGKLKSARATTRDNLVKELKYIRGLKKSGLSPQDAYIMKKIPVVPPVFRQIFPGRKGDLRIADSNYLYRDSMLADEALAKSKDLPVSVQQDARKHLYDSVSALYGLQEPVSPQVRGRGAMGFIQQMAGLRPRSGFFQSKLLRRRQEPSGRGTITPDQNLDMDEVGLPETMIWDMFSPFITKRLVQRGHKAVAAREMIKERSPIAREELLNETRERPVLINRAPSLYRHNMVAAYARPVPGATIRIPEMLAPILAGDFDGDSCSLHVNVTPEAVREAKSLTLKNQIFGDRNKQTLLGQPQHESVMGLYAATQPAQGKKRKFKNRGEALAAYHRGEISLTTPVEIKK